MDLIALEEIRSLKARYLRSIDLKLWDEFAGTLAEDIVANYGSPSGGRTLNFTTRDQVVDYMRNALGDGMTTVHVVHNPELTVDGDTASGTWCLEDTVIVDEYKLLIRGACYYTDTYRRRDGEWQIASTQYQRIYEYMVPFDAMPGFKLTANMWPKQP
ncbi:nuclear transport factor 2 family protein [Actinomadura barringtoniae]|uniref:Nuclear transport factor 2 family protein n=1 Tax=Actinomadura barringtoniae TaxID=1427535 RepID=A0A939P8R5_9ACTN|nr:nuclear transport factor 2 family protein [Actinomadura barringtoniae]MBO2447823.1 nuclear transport factor 2 family protein [Actinomadura barringtoniae]